MRYLSSAVALLLVAAIAIFTLALAIRAQELQECHRWRAVPVPFQEWQRAQCAHYSLPLPL